MIAPQPKDRNYRTVIACRTIDAHPVDVSGKAVELALDCVREGWVPARSPSDASRPRG
ncbi:hypothetical protein ACFPC0_01360 [Streptomyces andamanensis]|uniref:Uncharacterized protein n=1 Tax=Streptomyces andamanensis TaxID=1565035 RepID=A0ABV8T641_9ACTN